MIMVSAKVSLLVTLLFFFFACYLIINPSFAFAYSFNKSQLIDIDEYNGIIDRFIWKKDVDSKRRVDRMSILRHFVWMSHVPMDNNVNRFH